MSTELKDLEKEIIRIQYQIDSIKNILSEQDSKAKELNKALYEPDSGLYRRVTAVTENADEQYKIIKALEKRMNIKIDSFDNRIRILEEVNKNLLEISGANLESLRVVVSSKQKTDKLWWVVATAALSGVVKIIWDVITNLIH